MGQRVLVVGRRIDPGWSEALEATEWHLERATTRREALSTLSEFDVDCVVAVEPDGRADSTETSPGIGSLDAVTTVREYGYDCPVVLASARPDGELAAAATRRGITEYYPGSAADESLVERVRAHLPAEPQTETADGGTVSDAEDRPAGTTELAAREGDFAVGIEETATALDAVEDGVYVLDQQGRFVVVNESLANMTGYAPDELVGAESDLILDDDSLETALDAVDELVWGEESAVTASTTIVPKDGKPFPAEDHATLVTENGEFAGLAGVIRDVSERCERTRELERYESIIEAVDDGVYALDDEGCFEVVNDALLELTGYDRAELLGEHTSLIKDESTVQLAENKLRELVYGNAVETTFELVLRPESGEPVEAEDHMTLLTDDGDEFAGTAGVIRDISDRKERERNLRAARERFAELLDTSRALLAAHSPERVAEVVADAVAEALGYDLTTVRLYDSERERLEPVAGSGVEGVAVADRPDYAVGEGGPGRAFERSAPLHAPTDFETRPDDLPASLSEALYVPLGDHGVVSIGATDDDPFDDFDRSLAAILASNAAVALDRVVYEDELVQYRTVLENVQDMVYVADAAGRFSLVTEPLAAWLGVERPELVGVSVASVADDGEALEAAVADVRDADVESSLVQTAFNRAEGEPLPAEIEMSPLPADEGFAGTVGVVRDRSELVETRERLETQRDRFTYLFDNLPDAVVEASLGEDSEPIVRTVNDAFADVFGYDPAAITGGPLNDYVLPADERESGRRLDRKAAGGEVVQREVRREAADGYRDFLFRGVPFEADGEINSFGIYTDITEQKERERRIQVLNRVLRHNLRNDLNVVMGYAEMIAGRVDDEEVDEWAETLVETATAVASLSERARSLNRTMREGSLREETVKIGALVDEAIAEYREAFPDLQISADVDDATVVGDGRLALALEELLENSAEYGAERVRVRVEPDRENRRVTLSVADDGPGIPQQEQAVVDESTEITQLQHASGLGLWVVRWVCDACGGRLRFEESELDGANVVLSLTLTDE